MGTLCVTLQLFGPNVCLVLGSENPPPHLWAIPIFKLCFFLMQASLRRCNHDHGLHISKGHD